MEAGRRVAGAKTGGGRVSSQGDPGGPHGLSASEGGLCPSILFCEAALCLRLVISTEGMSGRRMNAGGQGGYCQVRL